MSAKEKGLSPKLQESSIPHSALQVYYHGISNEEGGLQTLLLLITINSFCNMYFDLQTSELLSGKAFNSMSDMLHFDVRNVSSIIDPTFRRTSYIFIYIYIFKETYRKKLHSRTQYQ
jgi:hypothetical protein